MVDRAGDRSYDRPMSTSQDDQSPEVEQTRARERILGSAMVLISRYGVRGTKLADIASRARLAKTTLYHYFPGGKSTIFHAGVNQIVGRVWTQVESTVRGAGSPPEALERCIREHVEAFDRQMMTRGLDQATWHEIKALADRVLVDWYEREHTLLTEVLEQGRQQGVFVLADAATGARFVQALLRGVTVDGPIETTARERRSEVDQLVGVVLRGFAAS